MLSILLVVRKGNIVTLVKRMNGLGTFENIFKGVSAIATTIFNTKDL